MNLSVLRSGQGAIHFQQKFQNWIQNLCENPRTGISKAYDIPEQVRFIVKTLVLVKNCDPVHIFDLIFQEQVCLFQIFFQNNVKILGDLVTVIGTKENAI